MEFKYFLVFQHMVYKPLVILCSLVVGWINIRKNYRQMAMLTAIVTAQSVIKNKSLL